MNVFIALFILLLAAIIAYDIGAKSSTVLQNTVLSAANLLNGMILIGAMLILGNANSSLQMVLGFLAVMFAAANLMGAHLTSKRLLSVLKQAKHKTGDK